MTYVSSHQSRFTHPPGSNTEPISLHPTFTDHPLCNQEDDASNFVVNEPALIPLEPLFQQNFPKTVIFPEPTSKLPSPYPEIRDSILHNNLRHLGFDLPPIPYPNKSRDTAPRSGRYHNNPASGRKGPQKLNTSDDARKAGDILPVGDTTQANTSETEAQLSRAGRKSDLPLKRPQPVTLATATRWTSELGTFEYLHNRGKVDPASSARLVELLDGINQRKMTVSRKLLSETRLAAKVRVFAHHTNFGADSRRKAREILDYWFFRFGSKEESGSKEERKEV